MKAAFLDKLIERISRVGAEDVQSYLLQLAQEKTFLETIFDALHEGLMVTDPAGEITYFNRAAGELFGIDSELAVGKSVSEVLRDVNWARVMEEGAIVTREVEVFYPAHRYISFYALPLRVPGREADVAGYLVTLRDVTETRRQTEETIESRQLTTLTMLAAEIAHELGNPLNSLSIHLQVLERRLKRMPEGLQEECLRHAGVMASELKRLDGLVRNFLGTMRPSVLNLEVTGLNDFLRESVLFMEKEVQEREIGMRFDLEAGLPFVAIDRAQMKMAVFNVIRNAFQAMRNGGELTVSTRLDGDFVRVMFEDTGGGIPAERMGRVFEAYHTSKPEGTGLGLLVVRQILHKHGGEVDLVSRQGLGLEVSFRLPLHVKQVRQLAYGPEVMGSDGRGGEMPVIDVEARPVEGAEEVIR